MNPTETQPWMKKLVPFLRHGNYCSAAPGGQEWRDGDTGLCNCGLASLLAAHAPQEQPWRCFHCEFVTTDRAEALAHFGDRDDAEEFKPLCKWWESMTPEERGEALQDAIQQVNERDEEIAELRTKLDALAAPPVPATPCEQPEKRLRTWGFDAAMQLLICEVCEYAGDTEDEMQRHMRKPAAPSVPPGEENKP